MTIPIPAAVAPAHHGGSADLAVAMTTAVTRVTAAVLVSTLMPPTGRSGQATRWRRRRKSGATAGRAGRARCEPRGVPPTGAAGGEGGGGGGEGRRPKRFRRHPRTRIIPCSAHRRDTTARRRPAWSTASATARRWQTPRSPTPTPTASRPGSRRGSFDGGGSSRWRKI